MCLVYVVCVCHRLYVLAVCCVYLMLRMFGVCWVCLSCVVSGVCILSGDTLPHTQSKKNVLGVSTLPL